jgi:hypothetical protein
MRGISIAVMALLALVPLSSAAQAKNDKTHGNPYSCPPGLAKKSPACVPPGLARAGEDDHDDDHHHHWDYRVGEVIDGDYVILRRPERYGLDPNGRYFRVGDNVYRVDRDTRAVLQIIGGLAVLLD